MKENEEKRSHKRIGTPSNPLRVKIKKLGDSSVIPTYAHETDAGMDLYCTKAETDGLGNLVCHTGVAIQIPRGYVGLLFPRSSVAHTCLFLHNAVGILDSGYTGEITFKFAPVYSTSLPHRFWERIKYLLSLRVHKDNSPFAINTTHHFVAGHVYEVGDRIGQLIIMPYPKVQMVEVDELSETDRGTGGYGSTGK